MMAVARVFLLFLTWLLSCPPATAAALMDASDRMLVWHVARLVDGLSLQLQGLVLSIDTLQLRSAAPGGALTLMSNSLALLGMALLVVLGALVVRRRR